MKLLYITNARIPTEKAHGYQIVKMCGEFALAGWEVELAVPFRKNTIKKDVFEFYDAPRNFKFRSIASPDFLRGNKIFGRLGFYLQWLAFIARLFFFRANKNVLIYTRDQGVAWVFSRRGFNVCYECHGWAGVKSKMTLARLERVAFFVVTNSFIKKEFIKSGISESKILVAPNGIDLEIFYVELSRNSAAEKLNLVSEAAGKKILLYTGSFKTMGFEKGIEDTLKALRIINRPDYLFLAVGGNEKDIVYYKKIARDLGVDGRVLFFSRQTQQRLAIFQKLADVLLMPFPKIAHYEFFMVPLKTFEYMAAGRPIVASDLPSIREFLGEQNCLFCQPGDAADLAEKIKRILEDPALAARLGEQARRDVEQYTWKRRANKISEFIKSSRP